MFKSNFIGYKMDIIAYSTCSPLYRTIVQNARSNFVNKRWSFKHSIVCFAYSVESIPFWETKVTIRMKLEIVPRAPALHEQRITPDAEAILADFLAKTNQPEAAAFVQCDARGIVFHDTGCQRPETRRLRSLDQRR